MAVERIGEVIESSSTAFTVQCYRLYDAPSLGALVRAGEPAIYAVAHNITTRGLDPTRRPAARGENEPTLDAVYQSNPQIAQLLRTEFQAIIIGYSQANQVCQLLPPLPPRIHAFVHPCTPEETQSFAGATDFLPLLVASPQPNRDDLVIACLRQLATAQKEPRSFMVRAGKELAGLLSGEGPRLNTLLRRLLA